MFSCGHKNLWTSTSKYRNFIDFRRMASQKGGDTNLRWVQRPGFPRLACNVIKGRRDRPTVIYVPGFGSGRNGNKAVHMEKFAVEQELSYIRYDPVAMGESDGDLRTVEFKDWALSAKVVLEELGGENNILIGSSMGGWISLLLMSGALGPIQVGGQTPAERNIRGVILVAPSLNFLRPRFEMLVQNLPDETKARLEQGDTVIVDNEAIGLRSIPVRKGFFDNSKELEIDVSAPLKVDVPVVILHGTKDDKVPIHNSLDLLEILTSTDVELTYVKDAEHMFSRPDNLKMLCTKVSEMMEKCR